MGVRSSLASMGVRIVNGISRATGRGSGTVIGGRVGLALDPKLLQSLSASRSCALVSGTNGKTTTTALLTAALGVDGHVVASNSTGSNMPAGHVAALVGNSSARRVVLEVDEAYVPQVAEQVDAEVVVLLNLSRDQLDRMSEVRMLAERWRSSLGSLPRTTVVANCDDPLVAYAAGSSSSVVWVAGGLAWNQDATGCPSCGGHISFTKSSEWACGDCDFRRPSAQWSRSGNVVTGPGVSAQLALSLPGSFNLDNAVIALAAAASMGSDPTRAAKAMASVHDVAGRFIERTIDSVATRLMLAKNPAGWAALLGLVADDIDPVVVSINARTADGADPSWLFDVDFSALSGRRVIATGDRWRDLSVRLRYCEVDHETEADPRRAVTKAGDTGSSRVEVIGNYTAFRDLLEAR